MISKKITLSAFVRTMRCKLIKSEDTYMYKQAKQAFPTIPNQCTTEQNFLAKALIPHFGICSLKLTKFKHLQKSYVISCNNSCLVVAELRFELVYLKQTKMKQIH